MHSHLKQGSKKISQMSSSHVVMHTCIKQNERPKINGVSTKRGALKVGYDPENEVWEFGSQSSKAAAWHQWLAGMKCSGVMKGDITPQPGKRAHLRSHPPAAPWRLLPRTHCMGERGTGRGRRVLHHGTPAREAAAGARVGARGPHPGGSLHPASAYCRLA